jgi:hypothetical protein
LFYQRLRYLCSQTGTRACVFRLSCPDWAARTLPHFLPFKWTVYTVIVLWRAPLLSGPLVLSDKLTLILVLCYFTLTLKNVLNCNTILYISIFSHAIIRTGRQFNIEGLDTWLVHSFWEKRNRASRDRS